MNRDRDLTQRVEHVFVFQSRNIYFLRVVALRRHIEGVLRFNVIYLAGECRPVVETTQLAVDTGVAKTNALLDNQPPGWNQVGCGMGIGRAAVTVKVEGAVAGNDLAITRSVGKECNVRVPRSKTCCLIQVAVLIQRAGRVTGGWQELARIIQTEASFRGKGRTQSGIGAKSAVTAILVKGARLEIGGTYGISNRDAGAEIVVIHDADVVGFEIPLEIVEVGTKRANASPVVKAEVMSELVHI